MNNKTLFISSYISISQEENLDNPELGNILGSLNTDFRYDVVAEVSYAFDVAALAVASLALPTGSGLDERHVVFCQVTSGEVTLKIDHETAGGTALSFFSNVKSSADVPAFACTTVRNITAITVTGVSATSALRVLIARFYNPTDPRLTGSSFSDPNNPNQTLDPGFVPLGGIIPISGYFSSAGGTGTYSETLITPLPDWLWPCDGSIISDVDSPLYGKYTPDLTSRVLRQGTAGTYAGSTNLTVDNILGSTKRPIVFNPLTSYYDCQHYMRIK